MRKKSRMILVIAVSAATALVLGAPAFAGGSCGGDASSGVSAASADAVWSADKTQVAHVAAKQDIVEIAAANESFSTLVKAVQAAGLADILKGDGPFTVFAPTNEAFAKLPKGTLEALLADKEKLTQVLTYHVVPGKVTSGKIAGMDQAKTVQGQSVKIDTRDGVKVDGAKVLTADIEASNGIIHVIDSVILPKGAL